MTANTFGYFSASSTARRLLSTEVPIVMMRVTPASVGAAQDIVKVRREIRIIKMGVGFYDCHFDRSEAKWRNLLLFNVASGFGTARDARLRST